jgi:hypothetical protein
MAVLQFIHSFIEGLPSHFHLCAIMNRATMNICVQALVLFESKFSLLWDKYLAVQLLIVW